MARTTKQILFSDEDDGDADEGEMHTARHPYCDDPLCWCHLSVPYHEEVTDPVAASTDEEAVAKAWSFFGFGRK